MTGAGARDRFIRIEKPAHTRAPSGSTTETWALVVEVWAQVRTLRGREFQASQQEHGEVTTRFKFPYVAGLQYDMRIDARPRPERLADPTGGVRYDIKSIGELGRLEKHEVLAVVRVP